MPSCRSRFLDAVGGDEISVEQLGVGGVQVIEDHALVQEQVLSHVPLVQRLHTQDTCTPIHNIKQLSMAGGRKDDFCETQVKKNAVVC
jgi:hypothetical protein